MNRVSIVQGSSVDDDPEDDDPDDPEDDDPEDTGWSYVDPVFVGQVVVIVSSHPTPDDASILTVNCGLSPESFSQS